MITISGYKTGKKIHESTNSLVYRGYRETDNQPVILKILKDVYPPPEEIARLKREYEFTNKINVAGIVNVYKLDKDQQHWFMVLEDFDGESLAQLMTKHTFSWSPQSVAGNAKKISHYSKLDEFLPLAIQIAEILGQVHRHNIVHKDINPSNIVYNPSTKKVKLIDFGISETVSRHGNIQPPTMLTGTLAYISPEQTARMNRAVDCRADLYSLGVTFYELLTGQLPFQTHDALELIHSHIAKQPVPPSSSSYSSSISDIVMKLMAKNAVDRYQSAYGLQADLETCWQQWQTNGKISPFPLGRHDNSDTFQLSKKLYGREQEVETLLNVFEQVNQERSCEMILVSGESGIGKSALVQEMYKPISEQHGYFISGQFNQSHQNVPYTALFQAFQSLIQYLLTEGETKITTWKERLLTVLGSNGQIIADVIPEVELIIGESPPIPDLGPAEAQNRFKLVFQNFINVFTQPEHPLVIFLDNIHWADNATRYFLTQLVTAADSHHLMIIGTYRKDDISDTHAMFDMIADIEQEDKIVHRVHLSSLELAPITQFVADSFNCVSERAKSFAEVLLTKTHGNPFFMNEFLKTIYKNGIFKYDYEQQHWTCDTHKIQAQLMTDNVVDLMSNKIARLKAHSQKILNLAACIGNTFDLYTLTAIYNHAPHKTIADMHEAIEMGLVISLVEAYRYKFEADDELSSFGITYKFAHNRIYRALYEQVHDADRQNIHWQVGQFLVANLPAEDLESRIFEVVNHLNVGEKGSNTTPQTPSIQSEGVYRNKLIELNLTAAQKAKSSAAYQAAYGYIKTSISLSNNEDWHDYYDLMLTVYTQGAELAYLNSDFEHEKFLIEQVLKRSKTLLDKVHVYEVQIQSLIAQDKSLESIRKALQTLRLLGVNLPENPSKLFIAFEMVKIKFKLIGKEIGDLANLPEMTDPHKLAIMRIMNRAGTPAYNTAPNLYAVLSLRRASLSITHGNSSMASTSYATYGLLSSGVVGDFDTGCCFGKLAMTMMERYKTGQHNARVMLVTSIFIRHWKHHLRDSLEPLYQAYQAGSSVGDFEYASLALSLHSAVSFIVGENLNGFAQNLARNDASINQMGQEKAVQLNRCTWQIVANLLGQNDPSHLLVGKYYDHKKMVSFYRQAHDFSSLVIGYYYQMVIAYLFHEYAFALENAEQAERYIQGISGLPNIAVVNFYGSLTRLALYERASSSGKRRFLKKVNANQKKLKKWAYYAPMNQEHRYHLVEAEKACVLGKCGQAWEQYTQAIDFANKNGYINDKAVAYECAAKFHMEHGDPQIATLYLKNAHYAYHQWGASAKVEQLENKYPSVFVQIKAGMQTTTSSTLVNTVSKSTSSSLLDFASIIKASQAISSEIDLNKLLATLIKVVIENVGAQHGHLILSEQGQLSIEAYSSIEQESTKTKQVLLLQLHDSEAFPIEIIHYVARTRKHVVLNDARHEGRFSRIPYIKIHQPLSILCTPLIHHNELKGILYLENNLTTNAFTPDHLEIIHMLGTQATISIANTQAITAQAEQERLRLEQEQLRFQNQLLETQSKELARLNADKDKFFSIVAHDLKGPFNPLLGAAELMMFLVKDAPREELKEMVEIIQASAKNVYDLLENLLQWARIQMGRMEYKPLSIHLKELADVNIRLLSANAKDKKITLQSTVTDDIIVHADDHMLDTVIRNITSNALKFTPSGGSVTISAESDKSQFVTVAVTDTGVGISQKDVASLFKIDVHHSTVGTDNEQGTGLGLIMCKEMVKKNGGRIWVESELGKGTAVKFTVPIAQKG